MATNKKIENKHYVKLISVLSTIEKNGISNTEELKCSSNIVLWNEFWYATQNFINYFALQSKTTINKKGEILPGNKEKVKTLINRTYKEEEDIQADILLHIMSKASHILAQSPVTKQVSYMYRCINNKLYDYIRALPAEDTLSLDTPYKIDSMEDGAVLGDIIGDDSFNPERMYFESKNIEELTALLKEKRAKDLAEKRERDAKKRESLMQELKFFATKPAYILVRVATVYNNTKPKELANQIIEENNLENTYAKVLAHAAKKYQISTHDLHSMLTDKPSLNGKHLKVESGDIGTISSKLYNINNRAKDFIEKRKSLLNELEILSSPEFILARTACVYDNITPEDLAKQISKYGLKKTYENVLHHIGKKYKINSDEIYNILANKPLTGNQFKIVEKDTTKTAEIICDIASKAKNTIEATNTRKKK